MKFTHRTIVRNLLAATTLIAAVTAVSSAGADPIRYGITGIFDGQVDDVAFFGRTLTLTATGDTDDAQDVFGEMHLPVASLNLTFGTDIYTIDDPALFFLSPDAGLGGIATAAGDFGFLRFEYDPSGSTTRFPVTFFTDDLTTAFATSGGAYLITAGSGMSLVAGAAPEPASWALMVGGFGMLGGAMRRRYSVRVAA